ncbi:MAG: hypothetical protein IJK00_04485 [Clostridia bacterium]|nr:hypothetical protein [Clostridia bacterium]
MTARSHFASFIEENTPGIYSEKQLKKTRASIMNVMLSTYAAVKEDKGEEARTLKGELRDSIAEKMDRNGISSYPLRTRIAYRLMRHCPKLLHLIYSIYRPLKKGLKRMIRR